MIFGPLNRWRELFNSLHPDEHADRDYQVTGWESSTSDGIYAEKHIDHSNPLAKDVTALKLRHTPE